MVQSGVIAQTLATPDTFIDIAQYSTVFCSSELRVLKELHPSATDIHLPRKDYSRPPADMSVLTKTQLVLPETEQVEKKLATLRLTGTPSPLKLGDSLNDFKRTDSTPVIGTEFERGIQVADWLKAPNADQLIKDLAVLGELPFINSPLSPAHNAPTLVSQRGVVFFRDQNITIEEQKLLGTKLGELTGKPSSSKLHVHPTTSETSELGDEISVISSDGFSAAYGPGVDRSKFAAYVAPRLVARIFTTYWNFAAKNGTLILPLSPSRPTTLS